MATVVTGIVSLDGAASTKEFEMVDVMRAAPHLVLSGTATRPIVHSHSLAFTIGGQRVMLSCDEEVSIADGHRVSVAGRMRHGVLNAGCYRNHDLGVVGETATTSVIVMGSGFLLCGLFTTWIALIQSAWIGVAIGVLVSVSGLKMLRDAWHLLSAWRQLSKVVEPGPAGRSRRTGTKV